MRYTETELLQNGTSAESEASETSLSSFSIEMILGAVVLIAVIGAVMILIGSLVGLGYAKFNLNLFEEDTANFKTIFSEPSSIHSTSIC